MQCSAAALPQQPWAEGFLCVAVVLKLQASEKHNYTTGTRVRAAADLISDELQSEGRNRKWRIFHN